MAQLALGGAAPVLLAIAAPETARFPLRLLVIASLSLLGAALVFVGVAVALRIGNTRRRRRWGTLESRWEGALLDMLSGELAEDAARFAVEPDEAAFFVGVLARYARRVAGRERALLASLAAPHLPRIARQLASRREEDRARAVQALSLFGGMTYEAEVVRMLGDPSPLVAMAAATALARRETAHRIDAVIATLPRFASWRPRVVSAMLAGFGPAAAPALRAVVADRSVMMEIRAVAVDALRALNDIAAPDVAVAAMEELVRTRLRPIEGELLVACLRLIGQVGSPAHRAAVLGHLADADPAVRAACIEALAAIGDDDDTPRFLSAVDDVSPIVSAEAARALAATGRLDLLQQVALEGSARSLLARETLHARGCT